MSLLAEFTPTDSLNFIINYLNLGAYYLAHGQYDKSNEVCDSLFNWIANIKRQTGKNNWEVHISLKLKY